MQFTIYILRLKKKFSYYVFFYNNKINKIFYNKMNNKIYFRKKYINKKKFFLHFLTASIKYNHFAKLVFGNLMSKKIQSKYV